MEKGAPKSTEASHAYDKKISGWTSIRILGDVHRWLLLGHDSNRSTADGRSFTDDI